MLHETSPDEWFNITDRLESILIDYRKSNPAFDFDFELSHSVCFSRSIYIGITFNEYLDKTDIKISDHFTQGCADLNYDITNKSESELIEWLLTTIRKE